MTHGCQASLAILLLLAGCARAPVGPRLAQTYPTAAEPFVYDVRLPGYLICGGPDGTKRVRLKLPTGHSAVEFNPRAGLALVLCVPDDSLARPFVHFYDATGQGLGWIALPREPLPGANFTAAWLADRPEALVFVAGGFGRHERPGPAGRNPETYYVSATGDAAALGLAQPLAVRFLPAGGYALAGRDARGAWVVRRYTGATLRWERPLPAPAGAAPGARFTAGAPGSDTEFVLHWAGQRYAGTAGGEVRGPEPGRAAP